jgi:hypothetical protein
MSGIGQKYFCVAHLSNGEESKAKKRSGNFPLRMV